MGKFKSQTVIKACVISNGAKLFIKSPELHAIWTRGFYLEAFDNDNRHSMFPNRSAYSDVLDEVREAVITKNIFEANYIHNSHFYNDIFHHICGIPELTSMRMEDYWLFHKDHSKYNYVPLIKTNGLDAGVTYNFEGLFSTHILETTVALYERASRILIKSFLTNSQVASAPSEVPA